MNPRLLFAIAFLATGYSCAFSADVLLKEDFNGSDKRSMAGHLLSNKYIKPASKAGPDGTDAIRVSYEPYSRGSQRVTGRYALSRPVSSATLSFDVCFEQGFDFRKGGKLHGLSPEKSITGGKSKHPEGWSARLMFKPRGKVATYIYDQNKRNKYGDEKSGGSHRFKEGVWYRVDIQVTLNSDPTKKDGSAIILVNGKTVVKSSKQLLWSGNEKNSLIRYMLFNTFHGGHDPSWSPRKGGKPATVTALFDNFTVREGAFTSGKPD
ncbi:MAG: polysaccharide lyase [Akkermansiaceae bacterium]